MNEQPDCPHFHAGKRARAEKKVCLNTDRRLSPKSRESWYAGWNHQDALMQALPTEEEQAQMDDFLARLRAQAREQHQEPECGFCLQRHPSGSHCSCAACGCGLHYSFIVCRRGANGERQAWCPRCDEENPATAN